MDNTLPLRPPSKVMQLERLGAFHQTRLSFVRSLIRQMVREQWQIAPHLFDLDDDGYGTAVYQINASHDETYSMVFFSQPLSDAERTDRVIAEKWDICAVLCEGLPSNERLADLRRNVPKQEAGRNRADVLVLCRANKSGRNFKMTVDALANGQQPDVEQLKQVGYLVRTTAVYGNGKFGVADYAKLQTGQSFTRSFSAQMLAVYMMRHFSLTLVEHLAQRRAPQTAVLLRPEIGRYFGVGNATGLGMAPFLIKHPQLIHHWIAARETALARVLHRGPVKPSHVAHLKRLLAKAGQHFSETSTDDRRQQQQYDQMVADISAIQAVVEEERNGRFFDWQQLLRWTADHCLIETEELLVSLLLELYPELVDELEDKMVSREAYTLQGSMSLYQLKRLIETQYGWALDIDFDDPKARHFFWYRSAEKEEPRLGERFVAEGAEKEQQLAIGQAVATLYAHLASLSEAELLQTAVHFLLQQPQFKGILRRIQSLVDYPYGEIQANLLGEECLPIHLLRCKLSIFGASKFDPKSKLWTRITLFQGAPLVDELKRPFADDWHFPVAPH